MTLAARYRWLLVGVVCLAAFSWLLRIVGWDAEAGNWLVQVFRAGSGAAIGWGLSRYVCKLDVSALPAEDRSTAALAQAVLIAGGMIAVA